VSEEATTDDQRSWVLADPATAGGTRATLEALEDEGGPLVIGWADLTAPNLIDLLDDLTAGPGGPHLAAMAVRWPPPGEAGWAEAVAIRRGLSCLQRSGLALYVVGGPPDLAERLAEIEPGLRVLRQP
jgi:hypothetical protein